MSKSYFSIKGLFERGIHFVYNSCIAPRSQHEDIKRQEFILNTILAGVIPLLVILDLFIDMATHEEGKAYRGIPFFAFTCVVLLFVWLLFISRKGYSRLSSFLVLIIYFLATTYGALHWGVELPLVAISYVVIIIISSILISTSFGFISTATIALTVIVVTSLQVHGIVHPQLYWKYTMIRINDPIELSAVFFLITTLSWLSNREVEKSLRRARSSEKALLDERNLLEIKVEERTKEVKEMQNDKIAQLYRFAEFGRLSSGVFHDLMNALNVVVANVSQLEHAPNTLPAVQAHLHRAVSASKRMGVSIENARKQISSENIISMFSLEKEIEDALDMVRHKSREASVVIRSTIKRSVVLHGNSLKFYQAIINLLSNAIEACEGMKKGVVHIVLDLDSKTKDVVITVRDNGSGIPPDLTSKIFTPFFSTKGYQKGIGLGLSQTKETIEKDFNGTIVVASGRRKTVFTITIPHKDSYIHEKLPTIT